MPMNKRLLTSVKRAGKRSPLTPIRLANISWVKSLDRAGLSYEHREAMLDLHVTSAGETISIQYPGKESNRTRNAVYQYDFRPKVKLPDGSYSPDLTFFQIWEALLDNMPSCLEARALIGVIFYPRTSLHGCSWHRVSRSRLRIDRAFFRGMVIGE